MMKIFNHFIKMELDWNFFARDHGKSVVDIISGEAKNISARKFWAKWRM